MKKIFMAFLGAFMALTASAQDVVVVEESVLTTPAQDPADKHPGWFISVGAGPQVLFGDHDKQMKFGDRISPALDVAVGRWFSRSFGLRLMYSGLTLNEAWQNFNGGEGHKPVPGKDQWGYWLYKRNIKYWNIHVDAMLDLVAATDHISRWTAAPYITVGFAHSNVKANVMSFGAGLFGSYAINEKFDVNADLRGNLTPDQFDGEKGETDLDGILSLTVGFSFKF